MFADVQDLDIWYQNVLDRTTQSTHIRLLVDADFPLVPNKMDLEEVMREHFLYKNVLYGHSIFRVTDMQMQDENGESQQTEDGLLLIYGEEDNSKSLCIDFLFYDLDRMLNNIRLYGDSFQRKLEISSIADVEWIDNLLQDGSYTHGYTKRKYVPKQKPFSTYFLRFLAEIFNVVKIGREFWYGYKG